LSNTFSGSFAFALFSIWVAGRYFPGVEQMAACALIALGLASLLTKLLDANREAIWIKHVSPWSANRKLSFEFGSIFLAIFCAAAAVQFLFGETLVNVDLENIYRNEFYQLFMHNFQILITGTVLAVIYRAGGVVLILAWNALHWAEAIFSYILQIGSKVGVSKALLVLSSILPHLILEALAYVIAGLAGVFISIAVFKYRFGSAELYRVSVACLTFLLVAIGVLFLATTSEVYLAQKVFHSLGG